MSRDIQTISVVDDLQVTSVEDVEGAVPRTLRVTGVGGFNNASRVLVNNIGIDDFLIVSDKVILVTLGTLLSATAAANMDVVVVSSTLTGRTRLRLYFGVVPRLTSISGIQKLVQAVVKLLLTNVGSNRFRVQHGGNLLRLTAFPLVPTAKSRIVTALTQAVSATESQIIAEQSSQRGITAEERLLSLSVSDVAFDSDKMEVVATLQMSTYQGSSISLPLTL